MDEFSAKKDLIPSKINDLEQHIQFELAFYQAIAETDNFEIIPVPTLDGKRLTDEEKQQIILSARFHKSRLLYRVRIGNIAVVFNEATGKTGIVPEDNDLGFYC